MLTILYETQQILGTRMELPKLAKRNKPIKTGSYPCSKYLNSLEKSGRRSMKILLNKVAIIYGYKNINEMPWENFRFEHLTAIKKHFLKVNTRSGNKYSDRTINMVIYAVRGVAKAAYSLGLISIDNLVHLNEVKPLKITGLTSGRVIEKDEFTTLFSVCKNDTRPAGVRDLALINSLYNAGLSRSEASKLIVDNYSVRLAELRFIGKGQKESKCLLDNETLTAMEDWMAQRGNEPGPIFCPILKSNKIVTHRHLSEQSIYNIVRNRSKEAGIPLLSPQDMRRSLAIDLLNKKNISLKNAQNIMRHADIRTTVLYSRSDVDEIRNTIVNLRK